MGGTKSLFKRLVVWYVMKPREWKGREEKGREGKRREGKRREEKG